jgi:hypothetical protein
MPTVKTKIEEFNATIEVGDYCATIEAYGHSDDPTFNRFELGYIGRRDDYKDRGRDIYRQREALGIQTADHVTMQTAVNAALKAIKWAMGEDLRDLQNRLFDLEGDIKALPETIEAPDTPPTMPEEAADHEPADLDDPRL